jgi:hypothetical protein
MKEVKFRFKFHIFKYFEPITKFYSVFLFPRFCLIPCFSVDTFMWNCCKS